MSKQAEEYFSKYIKANDCRGELYKGKIVLKKEQWFQFAQDYYESRVNAVTDEMIESEYLEGILDEMTVNEMDGYCITDHLDMFTKWFKNKLLNK